MKKTFIVVAVAVFLMIPLFTLGTFAEDRVHNEGVLRSAANPVYSFFVDSDSYDQIRAYLVSSGYTSADNPLHLPTLYLASSGQNIAYLFADSTTIYRVYYYQGYAIDVNTSWGFDDASTLTFFVEEVGLSADLFTLASNADFISHISFGIPTVLSWIGSFVSSLFSGGLSGLLILFAIGIAVTALAFGIKAIKGFTWGS